jgi:hypothetical protein
MMQERFVVDQSMVKDVYNLNSPHGPLIVWESLYPQDKGQQFRYFVTVNELMRRSMEEAFATDGFFSSHGYTKAECVSEVNELHKRSVATMDDQCIVRGVVDATLKRIRLEHWTKFAAKYGQARKVHS